MPTYVPNSVEGLTAYGYGDTRNGVVPYTPTLTGAFPEYLIHKNETFFVETGSLYIPSAGLSENGAYITYCNPGWSYRARNVFRPAWVPFRKDFILTNNAPGITINDWYNKLNQPGFNQNAVWERVCIKVKAAGFVSWGRRTYFNNDYRQILVGANGQYSVQYFTFPYTNPNNPNPGSNYDGVQVGTIIKFFTEDECSIICFDTPQAIALFQNTVPEEL